MPRIAVNGVNLFHIEAGRGAPVVFVHEFGGDAESWSPQIRHFARFFRCVAYNARGYPPSDQPTDPGAYSQAIATADLAGLIEGLGLAPAHVVGLSMGSVTTLDLALTRPGLARSITLCGCGYGSIPETRAAVIGAFLTLADQFESDPRAAADGYAAGPSRQAHRRKDPLGWEAFRDKLRRASPAGSALTLRGVQGERPSLHDLEDKIRAIALPTLVVVGDEDEPALQPSLFLKRAIRRAGLCVFPRTGHAVNQEEPDLFNAALLSFLAAVEGGRWEAGA